MVRCRPLSRKELDEKHPSIVDVDENAGSITIRRPDATEASSPMDAVKTFTFDHAFGHDCKQIDVYNKTARPIVDAVLAGYNGTIFAYGRAY